MKARIIALYLPQFHPIPENDLWWGPGFTEWTNVVKAKPLYKGHIQPKIPADLGFYDLRMPEIREKQAEMARNAGIEGFCYYHYWFGGKQLLERPFNDVLESGNPNFPFCICWANHSWSNKTWNRVSYTHKNSMLIEQVYPGHEDDINHFMSLLPAFRDKRYIKVDGKPLFFLYEPIHHPKVKEWIACWRELAEKEGLPGLYLVGMTQNTLTLKKNKDGSFGRVLPNVNSSKDIYESILELGFDAVNSIGMRRGEMLSDGRILNLTKTVMRKAGFPIGKFFDYAKTVKGFFAPEDAWENVFPTVIPQWDRSPRAGTMDGIYKNATPAKFKEHISDALDIVKNKDEDHRIIMLKSWNEWGEGNYVEPDLKFGHGWLDAINKCMFD